MNFFNILVLIFVPTLLRAQLTRFTNDIFQTIAYNALHRSVIVATESIKQVLFAISLSAEGHVGEAIELAIKQHNISMEVIANEAGKLFQKRQNGKKIADLLNYIYVDETYVIAKDYIELLLQYFNETKAESIKFDENMRLTLNDKYAGMTDNKLTDVLSAEIFNSNAHALIVTALYFNATWQHTFSSGRYQTSTSPVKMMDCTADFLYAELEEFDAKAIAVPYGDVNLEMLLVLPNKVVPLKELEQTIFDYDVRKIDDRMQMRNIHLTMPQWTLHFQLSLKRMLTILGFGVLFESSEYVNMFGAKNSKPLTFSDYIYDVTVQFDEVGLEPLDINSNNTINPPFHFDVNHPYIFYIKDKTTIYFAGHIVTFDDTKNDTEDPLSTTIPFPRNLESTSTTLTKMPSTASDHSNCPEGNDQTYSTLCSVNANMGSTVQEDQNENIFRDILQKIKDIASSAQNVTIGYDKFTNTGDTTEIREVFDSLEQVTTSIQSMACLATKLNHQQNIQPSISARSGHLNRFVEIFNRYIQFTLDASKNYFKPESVKEADVSNWNETISMEQRSEDLEFVHIKSVKSKINQKQLLNQDFKRHYNQVTKEKIALVKTDDLKSPRTLKPTVQPPSKYKPLDKPLLKLEARAPSKSKTTKPPKKTTKPPKKATKPPKKTTKPAKKTTKSPKKTTKPAKKTTKPPKKTTKSPKKTTKPPKKSTKPPAKPTKAPAKTTKPPVKTTKAPANPTKAPVSPTKAPEKPTSNPTTTTILTTTTTVTPATSSTTNTVVTSTMPSVDFPTEPPGLFSTLPPSLLPTLPPSLLPTLPPSLLPTLPPSLLPTLPPSLLPTLPPSLLPTLPPSLLPTLPPNLLSTFPPGLLPTLPPDLLPTIPPVQPPFNYPPIIYPPVMLPPITIIQNIYPPNNNPIEGPSVTNVIPIPPSGVPDSSTTPSGSIVQTTSTTPNVSTDTIGMMGVLGQLASTIESTTNLFMKLVANKNVPINVCNAMGRILNQLSTSMSSIASLQESFKAKS